MSDTTLRDTASAEMTLGDMDRDRSSWRDTKRNDPIRGNATPGDSNPDGPHAGGTTSGDSRSGDAIPGDASPPDTDQGRAPLRILMADDHPIVLAGLKALVQADPGLQIVGEARDGRTAQRLALSLRPDVIVLDISMPEMSGAEVARALLVERTESRILILTVHEDRATLRQLLDLGVAGYLVKRSAADELLRAIYAVAAGGTYIDPAIAGKVVGSGGQGSSRSPGGPTIELSERETDVLRLIANGHSSKEISARLAISVKTIETYKARAMEKLGFKTRVDVVRHAAAKGWLPDH